MMSSFVPLYNPPFYLKILFKLDTMSELEGKN